MVTDLRTRRFAGLKKKSFEEVLKTAGIPGRYFYWRSFATWDVLLPSEDITKKLATNNITTKFFQLQPEYRGQRRIKVIICNVSMQLNGDVLAAYLSSYGGIEDYNLITSAHGMAYGDYVFTMILDRGGFHTIPHIITYRDTTITVIVEGRRPLCWNCKQLGHFSCSCPQKTTIATNKITATATTGTTITATTTSTTTATTKTKETNSNPETGDHPNKEEGWTQVKGEKKKITSKTISTPNMTIAATATTQTPLKKEKKSVHKNNLRIWKHQPRDSGDSEKEREKKQFIHS